MLFQLDAQDPVTIGGAALRSARGGHGCVDSCEASGPLDPGQGPEAAQLIGIGDLAIDGLHRVIEDCGLSA